MPADDYADPKKVREKKEKEDKVVQLAAVVHMEDEIFLKQPSVSLPVCCTSTSCLYSTVLFTV